MNILVDLDGTLADWNLWFDKHADELYPEMLGRIPRAVEARDFDLFKGLSLEEKTALTHIFNYEGFYADIPVIDGAVEAVKEMESEGHTVFFVSSPWYTNATCMQDKANWIMRHIGEEDVNKLILTKDKTAVRGDVLIDDKPKVLGAFDPMWTHILFTQPYNEHLDKPRITDWSQWRSVLEYTMGMLAR